MFTLFTMQHPLNEIETFFRDLAEKHDNLVKFVDSIGKTTLKKRMFAVHITDSDNDVQEKPKIYIQCLVHASKYYSLHELQPCIHSTPLILIMHNIMITNAMVVRYMYLQLVDTSHCQVHAMWDLHTHTIRLCMQTHT